MSEQDTTTESEPTPGPTASSDLSPAARVLHDAALTGTQIHYYTDADGLTPLGEGMAWWLAKIAGEATILQELLGHLRSQRNPHAGNRRARDQRRGMWSASHRARLTVVENALERTEGGP